jgi:hypothetical protein
MNNAAAPSPTVEATFHVEPHPDPIVQALINELLKSRKEVEELLVRIGSLATLKQVDESRADDAGRLARDIRLLLKKAAG